MEFLPVVPTGLHVRNSYFFFAVVARGKSSSTSYAASFSNSVFMLTLELISYEWVRTTTSQGTQLLNSTSYYLVTAPKASKSSRSLESKLELECHAFVELYRKVWMTHPIVVIYFSFNPPSKD